MPADIGAGRTRTRFREIAQEWLDRRQAGAFNQAMMELGATVCLPRAPRCEICPLAAICAARRAGSERQLPVKARKTAPVKIAMAVAVVERRGRLLLWQRPPMRAAWPDSGSCLRPEQLPEWSGMREVGRFRHTITHHHYDVAVWIGKARGVRTTALDSHREPGANPAEHHGPKGAGRSPRQPGAEKR